MSRRSKYTKQRHEQTRIIPHSPKGLQVQSVKPRPNDPCFCGSGLKQKKCHGSETQLKFHPTKSFQLKQSIPKPEVETAKFIFISLTETHKKDSFLTLERSDMPGYTYFMDQAIRSNTIVDSETEQSILMEHAKEQSQPGEINGRKGMVLPNTAAVRKAFGLTLNDLKGIKKNKFNLPQ